MELLVIVTLAAAVKAGTPILFAALGEIFSERAGILNLGLEGMMLAGAFTGFAVSLYTQNPFLGVLGGMLAGGLLSLVHGFICITLRGNQVVSGLALTIFGTGLSGFLGNDLIGRTVPNFASLPFPLLSKIPVIGPIFFQQDLLVYLTYLIIPLSWFFIYRTKAGLNLRASGQDPQTADAMGLNIFLLRYFYVFLGGLLCGLGGAYLSLVYTPMWIENMTAGRGWIAVALVIFATWNPYKAAFGAYLFGGINALQMRIQAVGTTVPAHLLLMLPYIFTILVLLTASGKVMQKRLEVPASLGLPYWREER